MKTRSRLILPLLCLSNIAASDTVARKTTPLTGPTLDLHAPGRIGLVAFASASAVSLIMPLSKGEGARAASAGMGPDFVTLADLRSAHGSGTGNQGSAFLLAAPIVVPPISGAVRGVVGAANTVRCWIAAESETKLAPARVTLESAIAGVRLEQRLRDHLLGVLLAETAQSVDVISDDLLRNLDPQLGARAWRQDAGVNKKACQAFATRGLSRVLEVKVHAPALVGPSLLACDLALTGQVRVRVIATPGGAELYCRETSYAGSPRHYTKWAADGAALLHLEFNRFVEIVAHATTQDLLHRPPAPPARPARECGR